MTNKIECNVCNSAFDLDGEGGTSGYFGAIPVNFCPWCLSCMIDMVQQMSDEENENGNTLETDSVPFYGS